MVKIEKDRSRCNKVKATESNSRQIKQFNLTRLSLRQVEEVSFSLSLKLDKFEVLLWGLVKLLMHFPKDKSKNYLGNNRHPVSRPTVERFTKFEIEIVVKR